MMRLASNILAKITPPSMANAEIPSVIAGDFLAAALTGLAAASASVSALSSFDVTAVRDLQSS
jgi:hypothetical protein